VLLSAFGLSFYNLPNVLAAVYTTDAIVLATLVPTIIIVAFVLVPDGTQAVLMGALRSTGDVWPATALYLVSFWLVMVPLGYALGVSAGGGAQALMVAVVVGCIFATVSLALRFHVVSRRAVIRRDRLDTG
jgi:MATE family multidrug resistance protein